MPVIYSCHVEANILMHWLHWSGFTMKVINPLSHNRRKELSGVVIAFGLFVPRCATDSYIAWFTQRRPPYVALAMPVCLSSPDLLHKLHAITSSTTHTWLSQVFHLSRGLYLTDIDSTSNISPIHLGTRNLLLIGVHHEFCMKLASLPITSAQYYWQ